MGENKNKRVEQPKQLKEAENDRWMKMDENKKMLVNGGVRTKYASV